MNGYPKLELPGVKLVSDSDVLRHIDSILRRMPDVAYVIVMGRRGQTENMICSSNVSRETKIEMLAKTHASLADGKAMSAPLSKIVL